MKRSIGIIPAVLAMIFWSACTKDVDVSPMLGSWKTSYGDTVVFSVQNGVNVATFNETMNPLMPMRKDHQFTYENNRLGMRRAWTGSDMYFFQNFEWLDPGKKVFRIQAGEWFPFINAYASWFTFTKI